MKKHFRSIFISDLHLGSQGCQADALNDFLSHHSSDYLYLVGDIIDVWALKRKFYMPTSHLTVIRKLVKRSEKHDTCFSPGNHDEAFRCLMPTMIGNIRVEDEFVHRTADGRDLLVIHGDCFDQVVHCAKWLALLGDIGYSLLLKLNRYVNAVRRYFGCDYWSVSAWVKYKVKMAVNFIGDFETAVAAAVKERGLDGVICGHIHHPEVRQIDGVLYLNTGDWVESCSALVEHENGQLELVYWSPKASAQSAPVAEAATV